jgi:septal ring factor EnvC (AmiA/AmiB activator)
MRWIESGLPEWLRLTSVISGADEDGENTENEGEGEPEGEEEEGDDEGEGGKEGEEGGKPNSSDDDREELKKALRAERRRAKQLERELKPLREAKGQKDSEEQATLDDTQKRLQASENKTSKLAAKLLKNSLDTAIERAARDANFIDPGDAVAGVNREDIDYDQDEEDPSTIDLDEDSVVKAVKDLARKKKHFIKAPGGGSPSGSRFGGGNGKSKDDGKGVLENYPALR